MNRRLTWAAAILAGSLAPILAVASPSEARVPIAADDTFPIYTGAEYLLDPLANDADFPFDNPLTLCGVELPAGADQKVYVEISDNQLFVEADPGATGSVDVTYTACSGSQSDSATATIKLRRLRDLTGKVRARTKSRVQFRNTNNVGVTVQWGDVTSGTADGRRVVPANATIVVKVTRKKVYWVGFLQDGDAVVTVGDGVIRGIPQPKQ